PLYVLYNFFFAISFAVCLYFSTILHIECHVHERFRPLYFTIFRRPFLHILRCICGNLSLHFFFFAIFPPYHYFAISLPTFFFLSVYVCDYLSLSLSSP